jgi:crotonobetainyl-CoA:carnitine CoA-transferase CaiB-like acyl-CoA transferase
MRRKPATALEPYRVLDLTGALGALCGRILAGLGADVIKIERPGGDPARACGPFLPSPAGDTLIQSEGAATGIGTAGITPPAEPHPYRSLSWIFANAGKRGVTLDVAHPAGRDLLRRLVATADFLVESLPPGYLETIGLGYDDLAAVNPALVMVRISPFGQAGPYRDWQATDIVAWAMGGQMTLDGDADRAPLRCSAPQSDLLAGAHAAAAAMTAHYARRRTGRGQQVDIAAQECVTWTLMIAAQTWDISHINPRRGGAVRSNRRADGTVLEHRVIWPCRDGFVLWTLAGGAQTGALTSTRALVDWMAETGEAGAAKEADWPALTAATIDQETYDRLAAPFLAFFARRTKRELFEGALARSIQLAAVNDIPDVAASPQLDARDYWADVFHPYLDAVLRFPGAPVKLSATPWRTPGPAPLPGQDNAAVYGELLGMSTREMTALRDQGAI